MHELAGFNSRLDPVQAVALRVKLRVLDAWNARRQAIAARYDAALSGLGLTLPTVPAWADPVWHLYVARHPSRDGLQQALARAGVQTQIHYPTPPHRQAAYAGDGFRAGQFPLAESMAGTVLSLPIGPQMSAQDVEGVIDAVARVLAQPLPAAA